MKSVREEIGKRLKDLREKVELTQEALAERAGLHPSYIGQIERGTKTASIFTLEKLANALNVPIAYLFDFEQKLTKKKIDYLTNEVAALIRDQNSKSKRLIYEIVRVVAKKKRSK